MLLRLDRIKTDGGTQPRAAMHEDTVAEYAEAMEAGAKFPPVTVFFDGERHWLADGFHRFNAARRAGFLDIEVEIKQGSRRDAILFSLGANATHGLRRTNEDKRRAVKFMLEDADWSGWSNRQIAKACGVGESMVRVMRGGAEPKAGASAEAGVSEPSAFETQMAPETRKVQRGDTVYDMDVSAIGRSQPAAAPAAAPADPDAALPNEIAQAESEIGVAITEVEQLKAEVKQLRETNAEMLEQIEWLTRATEGDAATEIQKLTVRLKTTERVRDDLMNQNAQLKREVARLERRIAATTGVRAHAA